MISLKTEEYKIDLVWQCPECKECTTTNIPEIAEHGIPLCMLDHYGLNKTTGFKMEIVSYLISDITDSILSHLSK